MTIFPGIGPLELSGFATAQILYRLLSLVDYPAILAGGERGYFHYTVIV